MPHDRLITCTYLTQDASIGADRWHAVLLYALTGRANVRVGTNAGHEAETLSDQTGQLLLVGEGIPATMEVEAGGCVACARLDTRALRRRLHDRQVTFTCGPAQRHQASYRELKRRFDALLQASSEKSDFAEFNTRETELALVRCLLDCFSGAPVARQSRRDQFCSYIDAHFDEEVTLAQIARHFGLTQEHFSKVFKREVGETFHTYLTGVRLDVATEQLCEGDQTVSRVALEAGFPNVGSFNQAFKARYQMTPVQYRRAHADVRSNEMPKQVIRIVSGDREASPLHDAQTFTIQMDAHALRRQLRTSWSDIIGLGNVRTLADARVRAQAEWLKGRLTFSRWRVKCDLLSDEPTRYLRDAQSVFDFLLDNGFRPHVLLERHAGYDQNAYLQVFQDMLRRFANRYGVRTIAGWTFETRVHSWEAQGTYGDYLTLFARMRNELAHYGMNAALMGPGMMVDERCEGLRRIAREAKTRGVAFGSTTICCFPATPVIEDGQTTLRRTGDTRYLRSQILMAHEALTLEGCEPDALVVGSWRDSLENSNVMNDSCYEGANIVRTILTSWDVADSICYNDALDLAVRDSKAVHALAGLPGLLTSDGIPKPSFWAFDFLGHVNCDLIFADDRCIASTNDMGNYQIVCHNCERVNATYLATPETQVDYRQMSGYFDAPGERVAHVRISGVRPGTYVVKTRFINASGGSVVDEAMRMRLWCLDEPTRSEIERLMSCAAPQLMLERVLVSDDGVLEFSHSMQSNEIAYFHVIYLY